MHLQVAITQNFQVRRPIIRSRDPKWDRIVIARAAIYLHGIRTVTIIRARADSPAGPGTVRTSITNTASYLTVYTIQWDRKRNSKMKA